MGQTYTNFASPNQSQYISKNNEEYLNIPIEDASMKKELRHIYTSFNNKKSNQIHPYPNSFSAKTPQEKSNTLVAPHSKDGFAKTPLHMVVEVPPQHETINYNPDVVRESIDSNQQFQEIV